MYNCGNCDKEDKKQRGCKRKKGNKNYKVQVSCTCEGKNSKCLICKGKGKFILKTCLSKFCNDNQINFLLPYFFVWKDSKRQVFPDAKPMLLQPTKMLDAFNIMNQISIEREISAIKNESKK